MTYSDTAGTEVAQVRALIPDHVSEGAAHFTDEDIEVFLDLNGDDPVLAAAAGLEAWATTLALDEHRVVLGDYQEDTKGRAKALLDRAKALREAAENTPAFAIAEIASDGPLGFAGRDILVNRALTGELG